MKSKSFIFLVVLIFMIVFSLSAVSADDLQTTDSGEVSGDVEVATINPWTTSDELNYVIPAEAADIRNADVYVNVYAGSAQPTYGANANVSLKTENGENQIASEELWIEDGSSDGTIYPVNDHTDKCYLDYQMRYDITDSLKGLNGTSIAIKVDTFKMENKSFDGRIKLIALVLAYDDGDSDVVSYWVDSTQKWTKTNITTTFDTANVKNIVGGDLINVALSSGDGNYTLNEKDLGASPDHISGNYYQFNSWNVSDMIDEGAETEFFSKYAGTSSYGSLKNVLTVLKIKSEIVAEVSFNTEYTSVPTCYAGTNNTLTIKANSNKAGKYVIELLADGVCVNSTEVELDGENESTILLTDDLIRPVDETTVNGAENAEVVYDVNVKYADEVIANATKTVPVLYNGNLGYDFEYGVAPFEQIEYLITGDIVIDVKDVSTYLGAAAMERTDVWAVNLDEDSSIYRALLFIPYNWFNAKLYNETPEMFNLTFNGESISELYYYRDQGNLGNYGQYGYGTLIYDVTDLMNATGDNTLVLNKNYPTPAVYPSALVYLYNTTGGTNKNVYFALGADLLANSNNVAGRTAKSDSQITIADNDVEYATLYVFAASAQENEGNIIFNGKEFTNVWNGTSSTTDVLGVDITDILAESNNISFVATGSTILALPQIIVVDTGLSLSIDSVKTEYTSVPTAYADTNNTLTVTVTTSKEGKYVATLYADNDFVDEIEVELSEGTNTILLTDPTIRPLDETTVNGANNTKVTYSVYISKGDISSDAEITVPVLYNGNLGKEHEYNATYIEDAVIIPVTGGVEVQTQDASTYMSAAALNRTDIFSIDLDNASSLEKAFVYIAYNWDKTGVEGPVFNVTFNGNPVTPKSSYRDQSNLGNYGKYGYGLFIYDVTELAQAGNNTLVLSKENGLTAVYPSNFIYLYNTEGSKVTTTVYMANGADLLANSNNNAGRIVSTSANFTVDTLDITNATLYVFAASAQEGEGDIIFNGNTSADVWKGTSSTLDTYVADVTDDLKADNVIEFVATGSTILALNQMIVTQTVVKVLPDIVITVPEDIKPGDNVTATVQIENATEDLLVLVDDELVIIALDENGTAVIPIENITAGAHGIAVLYPGDDAYLLGAGLKLFNVSEESVIMVESDFTDIVVQDDLNISFTLRDESGLPIANAEITYVINGTAKTVTTAADGTFLVPAVNGEKIDIQYAGNATVLGKNTTITVNVPEIPAVVKIASQFNISGRAITITGYAVDGPANEQGIYYATELLDEKGNPISNVYIEFAVNNKIYNRTTDENGSFTPYKLNMVRAGRYTMAFNFAGDDNYTNAFACVCVDLDKKPITIKAAAKSYKAATKTKKYVVTLSTIKAKDGKMYLSPKKVTLKVNGKTFTAKTNSKGQALFKITNLSKKAKYKATISYAGDKTYDAKSKSVYITVK